MKFVESIFVFGLFGAFTINLAATDIAFPASNEETKSSSANNRKPVYIPSRCKANELFYPGDQVNDWICDCQPGFLYHPETDTCYGAFTRGPCAFGQYLILNAGEAIPQCVNNPCRSDNMVTYNKQCYELYTRGPCPMPELNFVIGVNVTTLAIQCITDSVQFQLRFGEEVEQYGMGCGVGSKRAINGKCPKL